MRHFSPFVTASALIGGLAFAALAADDDIAIPFPAEYKTTYTNYFTGDRQNREQIISLYANDIAVKGARETGEMPYGSILVGELIPAVKDADGDPQESVLGHLISSGETAAIVLMTRIEGNDARYPDELKVGDWEFEVYSPAGENLAKDTTGCRECHHPLTDTEFMFSIEHLAMKATEG
ncbi:MAG: cytochrome P460 family protein [Pseudomonadota bacterium]